MTHPPHGPGVQDKTPFSEWRERGKALFSWLPGKNGELGQTPRQLLETTPRPHPAPAGLVAAPGECSASWHWGPRPISVSALGSIEFY